VLLNSQVYQYRIKRPIIRLTRTILLPCSNSAALQQSKSREHYECTSGSVNYKRVSLWCTQRFAGANFTAGGHEVFASWSRAADDSVSVKTTRCGPAPWPTESYKMLWSVFLTKKSLRLC